MNILTLLGSPRHEGNTAAVLAMVEDELSGRHTVERFNITALRINGCLGCGVCQNTDDRPGCAQQDDAPRVFERMMAADAVVYASPLYCWDFTAQMKALIDRHFCLVTGAGTPAHQSLIKDKPAALLVTCAGPVKNNADVIQTLFDRICGFCRARAVNKTILPHCTTPDAMGEDARAAARKLAGDLINALKN
jgi:multimeric flavodoxin WrbA